MDYGQKIRTFESTWVNITFVAVHIRLGMEADISNDTLNGVTLAWQGDIPIKKISSTRYVTRQSYTTTSKAATQNSLPSPLHAEHVLVSSPIVLYCHPSPLHFQHTLPPILGSPGLTTNDPGGGRLEYDTVACGRNELVDGEADQPAGGRPPGLLPP
jgi:hypothetical protein